jgi:hypothetical protein
MICRDQWPAIMQPADQGLAMRGYPRAAAIARGAAAVLLLLTFPILASAKTRE